MNATLTSRPANENAAAPITIWEIKSKDRRVGGHLYSGEVLKGHHAEIVVGKSIRLFGIGEAKYERNGDGVVERIEGEVYLRDFKIGDEAECHSYNLVFTGTITSITEKTVTVVESDTGKVYRLDIYWFARKNWDFDAGKTAEQNANWMD